MSNDPNLPQYGAAQPPQPGQPGPLPPYGQPGQQPQYGQPGPQPQYGQPQYSEPGLPQYGQPPQYGQYGAPSFDQYGGQGYAAAPVVRPPVMDKAVQLMRVGAGLAILNVLLAFVTKDTVRTAMAKAEPSLTPSQLDAAVTMSMFGVVAGGLIGAGLWLWMSYANGQGKTWARTLSTVFFAISLLSFVLGLVGGNPMLTIVAGVITVAVGGAALFFMYKPESTAFYQASSRK